jgi:hypothetical protein
MKELYAQGDIILEKVEDVKTVPKKSIIANDPDGAVVLARGEVTGHRHAFYTPQATLFRDDALARDVPTELYIGHVKIAAPSELKHEEHSTIPLPPGTYRVRRQREWDLGAARVVAD